MLQVFLCVLLNLTNLKFSAFPAFGVSHWYREENQYRESFRLLHLIAVNSLSSEVENQFHCKMGIKHNSSFPKRLLTSQMLAWGVQPCGSDKCSSKRSNTHDWNLQTIQWDMHIFRIISCDSTVGKRRGTFNCTFSKV